MGWWRSGKTLVSERDYCNLVDLTNAGSSNAGSIPARPPVFNLVSYSLGGRDMTKIISANYRDRSSAYRWLVRDETDDPESAVACKSVSVDGPVQFIRSGQHERGFGCARVAETTGTVIMRDIDPGSAVRLRFDGYNFRTPEEKILDSLQRLELHSDGSLFGVVNHSEAA